MEEQKASCLGTTAITADAKSLWMHLHCLMETSQPALKPLGGGAGGCSLSVCVCVCFALCINNTSCSILTSMIYSCKTFEPLVQTKDAVNKETRANEDATSSTTTRGMKGMLHINIHTVMSFTTDRQHGETAGKES